MYSCRARELLEVGVQLEATKRCLHFVELLVGLRMINLLSLFFFQFSPVRPFVWLYFLPPPSNPLSCGGLSSYVLPELSSGRAAAIVVVAED